MGKGLTKALLFRSHLSSKVRCEGREMVLLWHYKEFHLGAFMFEMSKPCSRSWFLGLSKTSKIVHLSRFSGSRSLSLAAQFWRPERRFFASALGRPGEGQAARLVVVFFCLVFLQQLATLSDLCMWKIHVWKQKNVKMLNVSCLRQTLFFLECFVDASVCSLENGFWASRPLLDLQATTGQAPIAVFEGFWAKAPEKNMETIANHRKTTEKIIESYRTPVENQWTPVGKPSENPLKILKKQ